MAEPRDRRRAGSGAGLMDAANGWFGMSTRPIGESLRRARSRGTEEVSSERGTAGSRDLSEARSTVAEGSQLVRTGRSTQARKVRTIPPFASSDPPSPPTSPRMTGTTGNFNMHTSRPSTSTGPDSRYNPDSNPSFPPLNASRSNETTDLRGPSIYGSDYGDHDADNAQAQWWTFALPGKHQAFRGLQAAWNGTMQANKELREESEHYGRDYFSPKVESEGGTAGAGQRTPLPVRFSFGPSLGPEGDGVGVGGIGPEPMLRPGRFKTMSLPGSRRHSTEGSPRMSRAEKSFFGKSRRSPVTEDPVELDHDAGSGTVTPVKKVPPQTPQRRPASVHGDSFFAKITPKPARKPFHITLPAPTFGNEPLVVVPSHVHRAQAPPTPIGWDRPWQAGLKSYRASRPGPSSADPQGMPDSPWARAAKEQVTWADMDGEPDGQPIEQRDSTSTAVGTDSTGKTQAKSSRIGWFGSRGRRNKKTTRRRITVVEKPRTRSQRIRQFWIFDAKAALGVKMFGVIALACALGISISVKALDHDTGTDGIIGSSPILTIIYAPPTIVHTLITMYREAFGKPIGLWGMRSKMIWVCFDLFFICVWASDLSLAISDFLTTPLLCSRASPWWTDFASQAIALSPLAERYQDRICARQAALISFVLLVTMVYVANMVLSLFRILERLATLHKAYEMRREQEHSAPLV